MSMTQPGAGKVSAQESLDDFLTTPAGKNFQDGVQIHLSGLELEARRLSNALKTRGVERSEAENIAIAQITSMVQRAATEAIKARETQIR